MGINWVLILAGVLLFCTAEAIVSIDVHKAKDLLRLGYHYVDVRTAEEFNEGYVDFEKVVNIPYMFSTPEGRTRNPQFLEHVSSAFNKDDRIVVGCQLGIRSVSATTDLENDGFKDVRNMEGGYKVWVENGLSVKKPHHEEL
ncbi:thiosulfate sulfurtransferase 18-like [Macadamia integrifolia]|uniref:thiosulfate sulfurtransferase 18-like n=1 Tax=Macadamia integrifolia TaxID=60698 RepID=UPI001C4E7767|nr:thiosulfate sulfurtransferase 18-like [Macadamia integrifolia]